jgi:hypothetical protein
MKCDMTKNHARLVEQVLALSHREVYELVPWYIRKQVREQVHEHIWQQVHVNVHRQVLGNLAR